MFQNLKQWSNLESFRLLGVIAGVTLLTGLAAPPSLSRADTPVPSYIRIEEDWVLEVLTTDSGRAAPQVVTEMAPAPTSAFCCSFELNHRRLPASANGGLQTQIWKDKAIASYKSGGTEVMNTAGETVSWTQYMERNGSALKFGISRGTSSTWGDLASANLQVTCGDSKQYFDNYSSNNSVERSAIAYGAHRVTSLKLVQVRKYRFDSTLGQIVFDVEVGIKTVWDAANPG